MAARRYHQRRRYSTKIKKRILLVRLGVNNLAEFRHYGNIEALELTFSLEIGILPLIERVFTVCSGILSN